MRTAFWWRERKATVFRWGKVGICGKRLVTAATGRRGVNRAVHGERGASDCGGGGGGGSSDDIGSGSIRGSGGGGTVGDGGDRGGAANRQ